MNRWMAEITYRTDRETDVVTFEEISDSHQIIEHGPNWHEIDEIIITLNRPVLQPEPGGAKLLRVSVRASPFSEPIAPERKRAIVPKAELLGAPVEVTIKSD